jgi:hypothetical protein
MKIVIALVGLGAGYALGGFFPFVDFIAPKHEIQFESDFTIKAGHKATSRYVGTSFEPLNDIPVEITLTRDEMPKLMPLFKRTDQGRQ